MLPMDPLAHALAGALIARVKPSKTKGLVLACVLGALVPDIDVIPSIWDKESYITLHRGFTHSLLGLLPMALLAAWIAKAWLTRRGYAPPFLKLTLMALLGVASHDLLDLCTSWGAMLLWPDRTRFAWDCLFIVDPWYWVLFAVPLGASFFFNHRQAVICWSGILLIMGYHALTAYNHHRALGIAQEDQPKAWHAAFPQPGSPFRWLVFNQEDGLIRNTHVDFLGISRPLDWQEWHEPAPTPNIQAAMDSPAVKTFLWFARVPIWEERPQPDGTSLVAFWDLRFNAYLFAKKGLIRRFGPQIKVRNGKVLEGDK